MDEYGYNNARISPEGDGESLVRVNTKEVADRYQICTHCRPKENARRIEAVGSNHSGRGRQSELVKWRIYTASKEKKEE